MVEIGIFMGLLLWVAIAEHKRAKEKAEMWEAEARRLELERINQLPAPADWPTDLDYDTEEDNHAG
jgi:hypothetical protein